MHTQFPPSNVSKWRTTNKISPRNWASHKAAHTIIQTLIISWLTPLTCLVCLCIVFSEIGGHFLQDILTHLVPSCANVRYWFVKLEIWTTLSLFLPRGNIKNDFFFAFMVLRKRFPKAMYGCKPKGATQWSSTRMNNAICRQDLVWADAKCDLANQSVSRDNFVFSLGVPCEL